jgi:hypothetical protein
MGTNIAQHCLAEGLANENLMHIIPILNDAARGRCLNRSTSPIGRTTRSILAPAG